MNGKSGFLGAFLALVLTISQAQAGTYGLHEKGIERINEARNVAPLSVDTAFGEQVSLFNGSASFANVDISVPGNSGLPVELRRVLSIDDRSRINGQHLGGFAEWDIDLPRLSSTIAIAKGWRAAGGTVNQRCSVPGPVEGSNSVAAEDYWEGYQLQIPGVGSQTLLMNPSSVIPAPTNGTTYPWITKGMWRVSCKSATKNGYAGQAFIATSPSGVRYHLDWVVTRTHSGVKGELNSMNVAREVVNFLVSRVEDRFGNWVDYSYSGDKLTGISSSDSRQISLIWTGNKITSATSDVGNWVYTYAGEKLSSATRPDGSKWTYSSTGALAITAPGWTPPYEDPTGCPDSFEVPYGVYGLSITAPSGATAQYSFDMREHHRSNIPEHACYINSPQYWFMKVPRFHWALTLISKTVTGPGLPSMTWNYTYGAPEVLAGGHEKQTEVSGPNATYARYTYGTGFNLNEGQLLKTERGSSSSNIITSQTTTYVSNTEAVSQNFPSSVGANPRDWSDLLGSSWLRPVKASVTNQQGVDFNWHVNTCAAKYCLDVFGNPTSVTKASTLPGAPSKVAVTEYEHNYTYWVLGQVKKTTEGTYAASETTYNALALPWITTSFGRVVQTLTYNADGTVATVKDGNNNTITLSNWYRGIPRSIAYPDTTTQSATVSGAGWVTSVTDENGYTTSYGYDAMGRLASVVYPTDDTTTWNTTTQVFQQIATAEYGVPAGHWRQTVATGNAVKINYYDGLWRPLVTRQYDAADETATKRFQRFAYDHAGRTTFASYPGTIDALTTGTWTAYDALGRPTSTSQDSELSPSLLTTTIQYLTGFQQQVTNPRGFSTLTEYQAFDVPTTDYPSGVTQFAGADTSATEIHRDIFGKPQRIRKRNANGSLFVDRHYVYDSAQQLCKMVEPEAGATIMDYDGVGNLQWSASGLHNLMGTSSCDTIAGRDSGRKVTRYYDARSRLSSLDFPDGRGNQSWEYWPDGLPYKITTHNDALGVGIVENTYAYNKRRMLTGESSTQSGWYTWGLGYAYDANGSLSTQTYPTGLAISYAPNALGQATKAQDQSGYHYASGASYYPNGAIKQFTYGNGIVHSMSQNARQLPQDVVSSGDVLHERYAYDANGNVSTILDVQDGGHLGWALRNRYLSYDGLDRLTDAGSGSFGGDHWHRFSYNALDNMTSWKLAGVKDYATYVYDGRNQLGSIKNSGGATTDGFGYDDQGNVNNKSGQIYQFDYGNRLRFVDGKEWYRYDGHGRRVLSWPASGSGMLSMYSNAGQVMYEENYRPNAQKATEHIYLAGSVIASRDRNIVTNVYDTKFQHTDALGSPIAVTNMAGTVIEQNDYEPYGAVIGKPNYQGIGYTGHVQDAATGLTYMQQRYYDPTVGRFLSVDPVTALSSPVGMFNRYRYANDNPYKFRDPDGRRSCGGTLCDEYRKVDEMGGGGGVSCEQTCVAIGASPKKRRDWDPEKGSSGSPNQMSAGPRMWSSPTSKGIRGCDGYGCGHDGARRGGGARVHNGADFISTAGQTVSAPTNGIVERRSNPYGDDARYTGLQIRTDEGYVIKLWYVTPKAGIVGEEVRVGQDVGIAQDLSIKYPGNMTNHVHERITSPAGENVDPASVTNY